MLGLNVNDWTGIFLVVPALLVLLIQLVLARSNARRRCRKVAAISDIESLMHESAERGERLVLGLGANLALQNPGVAGAAGLPVLRAAARRSVFNDYPSHALSGDGALACISQMVVRGGYQNALATELFRPDYALLAGATPYSYIAGLLPGVNQRHNAGLILAGPLQPETILALDLAQRQSLPAIALSSQLSTQAVFFTSAAQLGLGEDYFAAGELLPDPAPLLASMQTQDVLRVLLALGLLAGAALKILGVIP